MSANLENSAVATGKVSFHSNPKERQWQKAFKELKISLISYANQVLLIIIQARFQQYMNHELPDVQLYLENAEEPEIKLPISVGSSRKEESSRKTSTSALLPTLKPLTVWIKKKKKLWNILQEIGIPDHLICLLRNLYTGQESTVRDGHGTTDWFQIGKGVCQGCILLPCLCNLCRVHHVKCQAG